MLKVYINFAIITNSHNAFQRKAHQLTKVAVICFLSLKWFNQLSRNRNTCPDAHGTRRTSAPFRVGQCLNPYPPRYKAAFASSCILLPHPHQCALRFHLPENNRAKIRGFHVPHNCQL